MLLSQTKKNPLKIRGSSGNRAVYSTQPDGATALQLQQQHKPDFFDRNKNFIDSRDIIGIRT
jgi:hypothetical protein